LCGDLVVVAEGDRIPAGDILLEERNLSLDKSLPYRRIHPVTKARRTAQD
jgi:hypothetical protein